MDFSSVQHNFNNGSRDSYERWELYRRSNVEQLYEVVFERNNLRTQRLLLLGAGNGNDIDINYFEGKFEEVVLVDIDEAALNHLLTRVKHPEKFKKVIADLSGVSEQFNAFDFNGKSSSQVETLLRKVKIKHDLSQIQGIFDCIINCNYTTQLIGPFIYKNIEAHNIKPSSNLLTTTANLTNNIITELFKYIRSILDERGLFIHSTDKFEISHNAKTDQYSPGSFELMKAMDFKLYTNAINLLSKENIAKFQQYSLVGSYAPPGIFNFESVRYAPWTFVNTEEYVKHYIVAITVYKKGIVANYETVKNL